MLTMGTVLSGRYRIIRELGSGGFSTVYLAYDARFAGHRVAIKEFNPVKLHTSNITWARGSFKQEALVLVQLQHPGIVKVSDFFIENGFEYLVMGYIDGETLKQALEKTHGLGFSEIQVLKWAKQLCSVLAYLHNHNPPIIFRDLKPANIMVQTNGDLKLIDFGIVRYFKPGQTSDTITAGTLAYAAPEQFGQGQTSVRSDIYSLGVVLHELLTGHNPSSTLMNLPPIHSLAPHVSRHIAQAIHQALSQYPDQRFQSVQEFERALQAPLSSQTIHQQPTRVPVNPSVTRLPAHQNSSSATAQPLLQNSPATSPPLLQNLPSTPPPQAQNSPIRSSPLLQLALGGVVLLVVALFSCVIAGGGYMFATSQIRGTATSVALLNEPNQALATEPAILPPIEPTKTLIPPTTIVPTALPTAPPTLPTDTPIQQVIPSPSSVTGGQYILFIRYLDTNGSGEPNFEDNSVIYRIKTDGSDEQALTDGSYSSNSPSWSPDGRQIVFASNKDGDYEIYKMDWDGSGLEKVTDDEYNNYGPDWSPDGSQIVFHSDRGLGERQIYKMLIDDPQNIQQLTSYSDEQNIPRFPIWSPNGKIIAWRMENSEKDTKRIYIMNDDGSQQREIISENSWAPAWSRDSNSLVYAKGPNQANIYVYDLKTGQNSKITNDNSTEPAFSPDGERIVYSRWKPRLPQIWLMDPDGSNQQRLTESDGIDTQPVWSP